MKCLNRPQEGPASRLYFAYKIFGPAHTRGGLKKEIMKNLADKALTIGGR